MSESQSHKRKSTESSADRRRSKRAHVHSEESDPTKAALLRQIQLEDQKEETDEAVRRRSRLVRQVRGMEDPRSRQCPYLDTIRRNMLDFDFEKLCSISLSHLNVYACLVCGKYFQGRGTTTHAHTHSVDESHHVFLNLETHKFYCLPDNYEIIDSSLEDIVYLLNPTFSKEHIDQLDINVKLVRAYDGNTYYPGIVGLNNIKANDYCNVILHMLSHITPLRNFFLREENYRGIRRPPGDQMIILVQRFGELVRKLWNPRNFKTHVSPHESLQAVVLCSKKMFQFTRQGDAVDFLSWLLNALHAALHGGDDTGSTVVSKTFRGRMIVYSRKVIPVDLSEEEKAKLAASVEYMEHAQETRFFYLTCDLPPPPLYMDELKETIIPQVPMSTLLSKFNGVTDKEYKTHKDSTMKRFSIQRLPPYLILYIKRFVKNIFTMEKNPTIVNFPIRSIDFGDLLIPSVREKHRHTTYDLVANVVHDGPPEPGAGTYRLHLLHKGTAKWFEMQDLHVSEIVAQMIPLSASLVQVWSLNKNIENPFYKPNANKIVPENSSNGDANGNNAEPNGNTDDEQVTEKSSV